MNILVAPNAFKNSLSAEEAAQAIAEGLLASGLECDCKCFPIGDGGDGTGRLLGRNLNAGRIDVTVSNPLGQPIKSHYGFNSLTRTAIIELADASGIKLIPPEGRDIMRSTTFGTGQLIVDAVDRGAEKIILCIGGSATVDGGLGILRALGVRFADREDQEILFPSDLIRLSGIDCLSTARFADVEISILCDVTNPLLGPTGAARIFGPQKGAGPAEVDLLARGLEQLAAVVTQTTGERIGEIPHGGAAGGVAATLKILLRAKLENGIDYFLKASSFERHLDGIQIVITGEGSIDEQTLHGKGPYGVAVLAKQKGKKVVGVGGQVTRDNPALRQYFDVLFSVNDEADSLARSMAKTRDNLLKAGRALGVRLMADPYLTSPV